MTLKACERGDCREYLGHTYWMVKKMTTRNEVLMERAICCAECAAAFFGGSEAETYTTSSSADT